MTPSIADLVEVTSADTVVRLDGAAGRLDELVLTGDVTRSLGAVLESAQGATGAGFLLVGHFGSGKSHFLAALGELLSAPERARDLGRWTAGDRELALAARPSLAVGVPLVEYRAEAHLEDVVWRRAWQALGREPPASASDRGATWGGLLAAVHEAGRAGLLLLIDELSEFLRAKRGAALTEDLRFLQFLGEWARQTPVLVVGALQESLDQVASVSERELARIRDRYPVRLGLSMRHVEDLVRGRLVPLRPGADAGVEQVYRRIRSSLPGWQVSPERFHACYPLHPDTLALLDGLRFLLSQQRGAVDFICRQLRGDAAAGIPAWQERPAADLLCPDRVYDHFEGRLRERVETARLTETVVPYYERTAPALLADQADRAMALRAVKLLTLLAASPLERRRDARELAGMLLCRVSAIDPAANVTYLERAVLEPLAAHGAYVVARPGAASPAYEVELEADAGLAVARLVEQERARLQPEDRGVVELLLDLGGSPALSVGLLRQAGRSRRQVIWQNTLRHVLVAAARLPELPGGELDELLAAMERTRSQACLVVVEPEPGEADLAERARELAETSPRLALWVPAPLDAEEREFAANLFCRQAVLKQAAEEGRGALLDFLRRSVESDVARAREVVRRCYFQGRLVADAGGPGLDLPALSGLPFEGVLRGIVAPLLHALHPRHREVQPHAELVSDRHVRRLLQVALARPRLTVHAADREGVRPHVDGFLVPLGVVRKRGDAYQVEPDPARSPAVAELLRLVATGRRDRAELVADLAGGPVGLSEPETLLLLNAAVLSGVVEATRGRRRVEAPFVSLDEVERVGPGELLAPELRRLLPELEGVFGPGPHEPWDARVQQASWEYARAWLESRREEAAQVRDAMRQLASSPLHADARLGDLPDDLDRLERLLAAADVQAAPREGLERLLGAADRPAELLAAAGRVAATARFCRTDLGRLAAAAAYLRDPALAIPDDPTCEGLREAREEALRLAAGALPLAAEGRAADALDAAERFRRAFAATYEVEHDRFNEAAGPAASRPVTESAEYRALALLSEVAAGAVPDDRPRVDRALAAAAAPRCPRRVEAELALRPVCGCGFTLGTPPPRLDAAGLVGTARRGVAQHLAELGRPEPRARLERAAEDLASLGQSEVAADLSGLLRLAAAPERADAAAVARLSGSTGAVLRQVLRGGQVVVRRDLAGLRAELAGRRYPKRRLLELIRAWVEGAQGEDEHAVVEVVDSDEGAGRAAEVASAGATGAFLRERFPQVAALLPAERGADAFWLAAWWGGRPGPPAWLPPALLAAPELGPAAAEAVRQTGPRAELTALDVRLGARTLAGEQVAAALDLGARVGPAVVDELSGERLLRFPVRLAGAELARRLAAEPALAERVPAGGLERLAAEHALLSPGELAPLTAVLRAAGCLAALERRLPGADAAELAGELYPCLHAPVAGLLSGAQAGWPAAGLAPEALDAFASAARRRLDEAEAAFQAATRAGWPGCLRIWEVGETVVAPLRAAHGRVAVLLVDAMRADLWLRLRELLGAALPGRTLVERWAVVPEPTRTVEALASLYLGRRVAGGEVAGPGDLPRPFASLGAPSAALLGADQEGRAEEVRERWRSGPALTVAVATGVDELLHRTPLELAALLDESAAALERRVLPALGALPDRVPLVVMADHGFRENRWWGRGSEARYAHGGQSLEESVVPVATLVRS